MLSRRSMLQQGSECCHASTSCHNHLQRAFYPVRSPHAPFTRCNVNSSSSSAVAAAPAAVVPTVKSGRRGARQHVSSRLVAAAAAAQQTAPPLEAAYRPPEPHKLVMTVAGQQVRNSSWLGRRKLDSHTAPPAFQLAVCRGAATESGAPWCIIQFALYVHAVVMQHIHGVSYTSAHLARTMGPLLLML
jgi:hypothetical protein